MSEIKLQHEKNFEKFDNHSEFVHVLSLKQNPSKEETKNEKEHKPLKEEHELSLPSPWESLWLMPNTSDM